MVKKVTVLIVSIILSVGIYSQETFQSEVEIESIYDVFTKETSLAPSKVNAYLDMSGDKKFFAIMPMIENGKLTNLGASINGIGCIENAKIYIMLEDESVITKTMFNDFNCKSLAGFRLSKKEWQELTSKRIYKVKIYNRGYEIISSPDEDDYFIKLGYLLENGDY